MSKQVKQILALVLTAVLICTCVPVRADAAGSRKQAAETTVEETAVPATEEAEEAPAPVEEETVPAEEPAPEQEVVPAPEEAAPAEAAVEEPAPEVQEEASVAMPAQSFKDTITEKVKTSAGTGKKKKTTTTNKQVISVDVKAPEGAFPEGTTMSIKKVGENDKVAGKTYRQAIEDAAGSEVNAILAVDITFTCDV